MSIGNEFQADGAEMLLSITVTELTILSSRSVFNVYQKIFYHKRETET